ncbi:MAG TPA: NAD(P)H-hydrate dehydratase [Kiritimatiellia bacterium]|nr:NAD(P)H-hydrate dehydratase [Kiritimatiellia bacterium]
MMIVSAQQMRELDRRASEEFDIKGEALMERAGHGVTMAVRRIAEIAGFMNPMIHLIAGRGQNGGDAFVAARLLKEAGYQVEVWLAARINQISGDALIHYGKMKQAGVEAYEIPTMEDWQALQRDAFYAEILVDGVLGTGISGPARGPAAGAIQYIRARSQDSLVVSIDIPSGLNADTGEAEGDAVVADLTVAIGLPKTGLIAQAAVDFVGTLDVVDIGIPSECLDDVTPAQDVEFMQLYDLKPLFKRRRRCSHKGDYGHVLVVGGSRLHTGAVALSARAALRTGAGLVTAMVPERLQTAMISDTPELMVWPAVESESGGLSKRNIEWLKDHLEEFSAVVMGPGMTRSSDALALTDWLLDNCKSPLVLDADAINVWSDNPSRLKKAKCPVVLTPHPGELSRLLQCTASDIQKDRAAAIKKAVKLTGATVILKGAGTLIAAAGRPIQVNLNGNPGMATAGSGDVLAGMIGGLLAQKFNPYDAARCAVFAHGRAGDYGAWRRCQAGLLAGDIIEELPFALRDLSLR